MLRFAAPVVALLLLSFQARAATPISPPSVLQADPEGAHALTMDVRRIVAGEEAEGWFSDAATFRAMEEPLLESVCRATPDARAQALEGLRAERAQAGDARELHRAAGRVTDAVERALTLERELRALEWTAARVDSECPFWAVAEPGFAGLQSDRQRLTLNLESSGGVRIRQTEGEWTYGGGGAGRLLLGWGFDGRTSVLFGPELGGSAMLRPETSASQLVINYFPALPLVLRRHELTWHWDIEAAAVAIFQADDTRVSIGGRLGAALGFTTLRRTNLLPWFGLALSYEHFPRGGGRAPAHFLSGALRVGLPWDP